MPVNNFAALGNAFENGKVHYQYLYKAAISSPGTAGYFVDTSISSGIPKYNGYIGNALEATPLSGSGNSGIYTGNTIPGSTKHLARWQAVYSGSAPIPSYLMLLDYLMFYPLIDLDSVDQQDLDNTQSLPRYQNGDGVRAFIVITAPMSSTANCTIFYTNSDGVSGRTVSFSLIPGSAISTIVSSADLSGAAAGAVTPFIPLMTGDRGIRSVQSLTMNASAGGLATIVLAKPIAELVSYEANVPTEKIFGFETRLLPQIQDGAYLNIIANQGSANAGNFRSEFIFVNS